MRDDGLERPSYGRININKSPAVAFFAVRESRLRYRFWTACVQYQQSNRMQNFRGGCC